MGGRCFLFQANAVVDHHLDELIASSKVDNVIKAAKLVKRMIYIDDILLAVDDIEEATKLVSTINKIFQEMGMKLIKYVSNQPEVLAKIAESDRAPTEPINLSPSGDNRYCGVVSKETKVIGMMWKPIDGYFTFKP